MKLNPLTQTVFQNALSLVTPNLKLADILTSQGYDTEVNNIHIHLESAQKIDFSGCQFKGVTFSGNYTQATFDYVKFSDAKFQHADFGSTTFNHVSIVNSEFSHSNINSASFIHSEVTHSRAWDCDFTNAAFVDSKIHDSLFAKSKLDNILDHQNIIEGMHIIYNKNHNNASPFDQAEYHSIKPSIALVGDSDWFDTPYEMIMKYADGLPITINDYAPFNYDLLGLKNEIKSAINDIQVNGLHEPSIAQQILKSDQPLINAIKDLAYKVIEKTDAVWIPGGPDVHPEFYGETNTHSWVSDHSYYREILEFSLTEAALAMNKTVFGVCHGSQLVNVYLGGTLHQHVPGHAGITPELTVETREGLLGSAIDEGSFRGPSYHHQAVKDLAPTLEVVATYGGVIKATQATDGNKIMLTQFHPEYETDQNSINILKQFVSVSSEAKMKEKMIELSDVIQFDNNTIDHLLAPIDISVETAIVPAVSSNVSDSYSVMDTAYYATTALPELIHQETQTVIMA